MSIISVHNLGKKYILSHQKNSGKSYKTLRETIINGITGVTKSMLSFPKNSKNLFNQEKEEFWALQDINFEIQQGDRVGIIGRNGAGKTTLLKLLSRITEPTTGRIEINGRIASLLEVGTGFHPELTGRENIFLNGAILGMKRKEIKSKFDEIVAFAEVEKFLDTPVKRYSSGMYVRLAFAVAAHLEPEILIVDEVLAVGDAAFQKKCLGKMEDVSSTEGRTILFVSHNMGMIRQLCQKGLHLENGTLVYTGTVDKTIEHYMQRISEQDKDISDNPEQVAEGDARFTQWEILNSTSGAKHSCFSRETVTMAFTFVARRPIRDGRIGFHLLNSMGNSIIVCTSLDNNGIPFDLQPGTYRFLFTMRLPIKGDTYYIQIRMRSGKERIDAWDAMPNLVVISSGKSHLKEHMIGILDEDITFDFNRISL